MSGPAERVGGSFRDPSGFVFSRGGKIFRQVNLSYRKEFDKLTSSGLYQELVDVGALIPHTLTEEKPVDAEKAYLVIAPERVPFVSYPYEWSFSQLKDAGLLTLRIALAALQKNMVLKDASAYNIQFVGGKPVLIDTLSFALYKEGAPWEAYRQFCQHFVAPLALAALVDIRLTQLMRVYIDGIPLDLASRLLPGKTRLGLSGLALHIHLHAKTQQRFSGTATPVGAVQLSKTALIGLLKGLEKTLQELKWEPKGTEWGEYYSATNYSNQALKSKGEIVGSFIEIAKPARVIDLGANDGLFSREASRRGIETVASDIDPAAVEKNYRVVKQTKEERILPIVLDLTNPSGGIGWANEERTSLVERGPFDLVMGLALIHHLVIANNVPLLSVAGFFGSMGKWAIVEFVPKTDSQVQRMLASRKDIFTSYTVEGFEKAFATVFSLEKKEPVPESDRILYLFKKK